MNKVEIGYILTKYPFFTKNGIQTSRCFSLIVDSNEYGPIIFDTGSPTQTDVFIHKLKEDFNLTPDDIKWVFNTHLIHPDHVGSNYKFKKAKFIFSKKELEDAIQIADACLKIYKNDVDLRDFLWNKCPGYKINCADFEAWATRQYFLKYWNLENLGINYNYEFIEDRPNIPKIIEIIKTPGHTFHHFSYYVNTYPNKILVSGDALSMRLILDIDFMRDNYWEPHMDIEKYLDSLNLIKNFKGIISPGHDKCFYSQDYTTIDTFDLKLKKE